MHVSMLGVFQSHPSGRPGIASSAGFVVRQALQVRLVAAPEFMVVGDCQKVTGGAAVLSLPPLRMIAAATIAAARSIAAVTIATGNQRRGRTGAIAGAHGGSAEGSGGGLGAVIYAAAGRGRLALGCVRAVGYKSAPP